jgi:hypothetical protein
VETVRLVGDPEHLQTRRAPVASHHDLGAFGPQTLETHVIDARFAPGRRQIPSVHGNEWWSDRFHHEPGGVAACPVVVGRNQHR